MSPVRVVVTDDHPIFRNAIVSVLGRDPEIEIVGQAGDGEEAVRLAVSLRPDVMVLDMQLPRMDGCEAIAAINARGVQTQYLILTAFSEDQDFFRALDAGARGYLLKESEASEVVKAVKAIGRGESHFDPRVAGKLLDEYGRLTRSGSATAGLSPREIEVLQALATGGSNQRIAETLHISQSTVKTHMARIFKKLNASNRYDAVEIGKTRGLIRG